MPNVLPKKKIHANIGDLFCSVYHIAVGSGVGALEIDSVKV